MGPPLKTLWQSLNPHAEIHPVWLPVTHHRSVFYLVLVTRSAAILTWVRTADSAFPATSQPPLFLPPPEDPDGSLPGESCPAGKISTIADTPQMNLQRRVQTQSD